MLQRDIVLPPAHVYVPDEWRIVETRYSDEHLGRAETVFALSNGFLGVRGTFEEGRPALLPGTFVNGFHETWPIVHAEEAHALARVGQTIINVPDATVFKLYVDDEPLFLATARVQDYRRVLDMRAGTLTREFTWMLPSGNRVRVRSTRVVSLRHRHLLAMTYEVTVLDEAAPMTLSSQLVNRQDSRPADEQPENRPTDPRLSRVLPDRVLNARVIDAEDNRVMLGYITTNSRMTLAVGVDHVIESDGEYETTTSADADGGELLITADLQPGQPIRITKYATYQGSRSIPASELTERSRRTLDRGIKSGFETLLAEQREQLDLFWDRADIRVKGGENEVRYQQAIRWNLFQLAQASWRAENAGISAKGLTGQAYDGHYFWDTEIYVLPFLAYTHPRLAANLLRHRHSTLDRARERARDMSQRGALFPWRTLTGEEASAMFQAGTAQYHINADIAFAVRQYAEATGDRQLLAESGAEILVETARFWEDLGFYGADEKFHIHGVTGPDEYTTVVNDNTYTNLMARLNLNYAAATVRRMQEEQPEDFTALAHAVGLRPDEVDAWEQAAAKMHVPFDENRRIHPQDSTFLEREVWDFANTPREKYPLLLNYHPLVIYRYQVLKQADIVLAMYLLSNEFSEEQKRRNFEYYDPLTTGDSSLSACVQSIIAAEVDDRKHALHYFNYALLMDLADIAGNAENGVHIASTGGVWAALVGGFGGFRNIDEVPTFHPKLPKIWTDLEFSLYVQDRQLRMRLRHDEETYTLDKGEPIDVRIRGQVYTLTPGDPLVLSV